jgi:hypothetical protein
MAANEKAEIRQEIEYCMELIRDTGVEETSDEFLMGSDLFIQGAGYRTLFMAIKTNEARLSWLRKKIEEKSKSASCGHSM